MAEGILRKKLAEKNLPVEVDSAGTLSWHAGNPPDHRSVSAALEFGLDISPLRGRHFTISDFKDFDLILVMDKSNLTDVISLAQTPDDINKVKLFLDYAGMPELAEVPDPYHGRLKDFTDLYRLLDKACDLVIARLMNS